MAGIPAIRYNYIAGPTEITITGTSATLAALMTAAGASIDASIQRITFLSSLNLRLVSWAGGVAAVDGVNQFPDLAITELDIGKVHADKLQFISNGTSVKISIVQEG